MPRILLDQKEDAIDVHLIGSLPEMAALIAHVMQDNEYVFKVFDTAVRAANRTKQEEEGFISPD